MTRNKYDVKKLKVVKGSEFLEDYYQAHPENLDGLWVKYGQGKEENPTVRKILCASCHEASVNYQEKEDILQMKRCYQVENFTQRGIYYDWDKISCKDPSCWGPKERCLKVSKKIRPNDGLQYMFSQFKIYDNRSEECVDRVYFNLQLKDSDNWFYEGIGSQSRIGQFFFPNLVDSCNQEPGNFFFVSTRQYEKSSKNFKFPLVWKVEHFKKNKQVEKFPASVHDLDKDHYQVARTFVEIYPGGAGLRVSQYKYVENSEFRHRDSADILCYESGGLDIKHNTPPPFSINEDHLSSGEVFIENIRDGFCGPVTSYYLRYNANNSFFP